MGKNDAVYDSGKDRGVYKRSTHRMRTLLLDPIFMRPVRLPSACLSENASEYKAHPSTVEQSIRKNQDGAKAITILSRRQAAIRGRQGPADSKCQKEGGSEALGI